MSTDLARYSRLMGDDESAINNTLKSYRQILTEKIHAFYGGVVESSVDSILAKFLSIVDTVSWVDEIQKELKQQNDQLLLCPKDIFKKE